MPTCYQATTHAGAWRIWPNPVWYPEGTSEIRFEMEHGGGFHRPILRLKGVAIDLEGRVYGVRSMSRPKESGYVLEGRVSIGGETCSAFTSSHLFQRPDGSLVDVGVLVVRNAPKMVTLPPHADWSRPTAEDLEMWADNAAATGNAEKLHQLASWKGDLPGVPHGGIAMSALSHRAYAIEERLKGNIQAATAYEKLSEDKISEYQSLYQ